MNSGDFLERDEGRADLVHNPLIVTEGGVSDSKLSRGNCKGKVSEEDERRRKRKTHRSSPSQITDGSETHSSVRDQQAEEVNSH